MNEDRQAALLRPTEAHTGAAFEAVTALIHTKAHDGFLSHRGTGRQLAMLRGIDDSCA
ncbi:MAG: hypothetical protein ABW154_06710 [Dyella sp.]